ncbi:MAG: CRTAC1 family protein [Bryobacteraceae bacterium]
MRWAHRPFATGRFHMPEIMGAGVALLDYDNDGDLDVYLIQGMPLDGKSPSPGNRLFRNNLVPTGRLHFTDVTAASGTGRVMYGMGAATGDYDNDGHVDLYVTGFGQNVLYHNNGDGTFADVATAAGVEDERWSTSSAFLDYDCDGLLDLIVLNYVDFTIRRGKQCFASSGELDYCTPKAYRPVPARLYRNLGSGKFTDVTGAAGIAKAYGPGLGVTCGDFDGDGWIDLYVANDTAANLLWMNRRNGTFSEVGLTAGAAYSEDGLPKAGMGVSAGDFDNDGDDDLVVVNLTGEGATLFQNDGHGGFLDASLRTRLRPATLPFTGFGVNWFDSDSDGWLDLFIANGAVTRMEELRGSEWPFRQKNSLLRNQGGKSFAADVASPGSALAAEEVSRGAAFGDIDNDGDVDIVVTNNNGPVRLLVNQGVARHHWLEVQLEGTRSNRMALGGRVGVKQKSGRVLWRRAHTDSSYLSASDPRTHFGLGTEPGIESVIVVWPCGTREEFGGITQGGVVRLREGTGSRR